MNFPPFPHRKLQFFAKKKKKIFFAEIPTIVIYVNITCNILEYVNQMTSTYVRCFRHFSEKSRKHKRFSGFSGFSGFAYGFSYVFPAVSRAFVSLLFFSESEVYVISLCPMLKYLNVCSGTTERILHLAIT